MRIYELLNEDLTPSQYRKHILSFANSKGIKHTNDSRHSIHVRFPLKGNMKDFNNFFNEIGISVTDSTASLSKQFETYDLTQTTEMDGIDVGSTMHWVNNVAGMDTKANRLFGGKELTPDNLHLAGKELTLDEIISETNNTLMDLFEPNIVNELDNLMTLAQTTASVIEIPKNLSFNPTDLKTISKDFGEVLASIWAITNLKFKKAYFPEKSNEKLVDFYGTRMNIRYPISVKSGEGGKVTIQNIMDAISNRKKTSKLTHDDEKSLAIFKIVNENSAKATMLKLHQKFKTKPIKLLGKLMKVDFDDITLTSLKKWLGQYSNEKLQELLLPFHNSMNTHITDSVWKRDDQLRFVISPLGENIWKYLNENKAIQQSLTNVAKQVLLIQVNIDVKSSLIKFQHNRFKDAEFIFGWAGYTAGNKLGFKMKLIK